VDRVLRIISETLRRSSAATLVIKLHFQRNILVLKSFQVIARALRITSVAINEIFNEADRNYSCTGRCTTRVLHMRDVRSFQTRATLARTFLISYRITTLFPDFRELSNVSFVYGPWNN
jgi:hypothetical protein